MILSRFTSVREIAQKDKYTSENMFENQNYHQQKFELVWYLITVCQECSPGYTEQTWSEEVGGSVCPLCYHFPLFTVRLLKKRLGALYCSMKSDGDVDETRIVMKHRL